MADGIERIDRRRFLGAAAATVGLTAVAGCTGSIDPEGVPERPSYGRDPSKLDQPLRYIVRSVHYQNSYFDHGGDNLPERPEFPSSASGYDHDLRFILESLEYQNASIESEVGG